MQRVLLCLAVLAAALAGCRGDGDHARHQEPGRAYVRDHRFSLVPPEGWQRQDNAADSILAYLGPQEGDFKVDFAVRVEDYSGSPPIEQAPEEFRKGAPAGAQVVESGLATIDGKKACRACAIIDTPQGRVESLRYLIPHKGKMYMINFACPEGAYGKHKATFEKVAESVRID
jgi:hypothetical protein